MVKRKDNRHLVLRTILSQGWTSKLDMMGIGWTSKLDMMGIGWHGTEIACDERWMILQIQQELHIFRFDMDTKRGRRQVEKNEPATKEALDWSGQE